MESRPHQNWYTAIESAASVSGGAYLAVASPFLKDGVAQLCQVVADGREIAPSRVTALGPDRYELLFLTSNGNVELTIATESHADRFVWTVSLRGEVHRISLWFPFLRQLAPGANTRWIDLFTLENQQGVPLLRYRDHRAPLVAIDGDRALVVLQDGRLLGNGYAPGHLMDAPGLAADVGPERTTVYNGQIVLTDGGWRAAFDLIRAFLRAQLDLDCKMSTSAASHRQTRWQAGLRGACR